MELHWILGYCCPGSGIARSKWNKVSNGVAGAEKFFFLAAQEDLSSPVYITMAWKSYIYESVMLDQVVTSMDISLDHLLLS